MNDKTLGQNPARIEALDQGFRQRETELENYYDQHGEELVREMRKTGYEFTEFAKSDPAVQYGQPVKPAKAIAGRPGRDSVDNAALLP